MRILLTGVAGFIASNVCAQLLDQGHDVVAIDNLNDAYDPRLKRWRLDRLTGRERLEFHQADITDRAVVDALFETPPDAVINLAARAGVRQSVEDPWVYVDTNTTGTLNLLEACRHHGVGKLVLASTSSLYGARNPRPFREDADTDHPLSPYAASKKAAEAMCYAYHHLHDIDVSIVRYFTVYGPAGRPDMSIFRFVRWIAEGEPLAIYGDGNQERDFTYVDDVARATIAALKPVGYEIINVGGDRPASLRDVIAHIESRLGAKAVLEHHPVQPSDVPATWADISKAGEMLGWKPQISLEEGLDRAVDWYIDNRDWARDIRLE